MILLSRQESDLKKKKICDQYKIKYMILSNEYAKSYEYLTSLPCEGEEMYHAQSVGIYTSGTWYLHIYAIDGAGNIATMVSDKFMIDALPPIVGDIKLSSDNVENNMNDIQLLNVTNYYKIKNGVNIFKKN